MRVTPSAAPHSNPASPDQKTRLTPEQRAFAKTFRELAVDPQRFQTFMAEVYGAGYDRAQAEALRQRALRGDFSWLPPIEWVGGEVLGGAHGAYDSAAGVVYLDESLRADPSLAAATYLEEAGHALDTMVNQTDSAGDEGELFRRKLSGEDLSAAQVRAIRAENDHGVIEVDGRKISVEFWNPFTAIVDAVSSVAEDVVEGVSAVATGLFEGAKHVVNGAISGITGVVGNLLKGRFADAFDSFTRAVDEMVFQSTASIASGWLEGIDHAIDAASRLLGPLGGVLRAGGHWFTDLNRTVFNVALETQRALFRLPRDTISTLFRDGPLEALKRAAGTFLDIGVHTVQGIASIFSAPSRPLSAEEKEFLRKIYGDSIDYHRIRVKRGDLSNQVGIRAHAVGDTIYLPDSAFNSDGSIKDSKYGLLAHEVAHVWQSQTGGASYIHRSLWEQSIHGHGAYDWRDAVDSGVAFDELNPEQQASVIEAIAGAFRRDDDGVLEPSDFGDISEQRFIYLLAVLEAISPGAVEEHAEARYASRYSPVYDLVEEWGLV